MPIKIQNDLPAKEVLEQENIFVMDETRALKQDIRPLKICILNLMPNKQETELHLLRELSNTPLQIDVTFMKVASHVSKNTSANHLEKFYHDFTELRDEKFDGLIITGAPVEHLDFVEVDYWQELCDIMEWSKRSVTSTIHLCWAAQAALYYHFQIEKLPLQEKMFGIYEHQVLLRKMPLVRGFDDFFMLPHSRHTTIDEAAVINHPELMVLAQSMTAGISLVKTAFGKQIFMIAHPEYERYTLHNEYIRDLDKGLPIKLPVNYYPDDDSTSKPLLSWRAHSNNLYSNWLNFYVYQQTPYEL
ncbi:MAG: homoserine O-succinyltransferase [Lachnospiraceae bacterium]|jgi:homoserine O-succinyltransferase|nr:homoserine O-succinyltransferase [Lachnospiraceae bacterium]